MAASHLSGHLCRSAEGVGFEPTMSVTTHSGFQDRRQRHDELHRRIRRPRLGTYLALRAAHDTAARHQQPGRWLLPEAGWARCQVMTGNPFGTDVCHLRPLRPGDISVTNDLRSEE